MLRNNHATSPSCWCELTQLEQRGEKTAPTNYRPGHWQHLAATAPAATAPAAITAAAPAIALAATSAAALRAAPAGGSTCDRCSCRFNSIIISEKINSCFNFCNKCAINVRNDTQARTLEKRLQNHCYVFQV